MYLSRVKIFVLLASALALTIAVVSAADDYDLSWHTIDGGGGTSTGGAPGNEYTLSGTIGQPDAGVMSGGAPGNEYVLAGGFWAGGSIGDPAPTCPADLDNNRAVGVSDLLILLSAWGPNPGHPADLSGDGIVGVADLLLLLANWGPCP